jgi:hypothetical protein
MRRMNDPPFLSVYSSPPSYFRFLHMCLRKSYAFAKHVHRIARPAGREEEGEWRGIVGDECLFLAFFWVGKEVGTALLLCARRRDMYAVQIRT